MPIGQAQTKWFPEMKRVLKEKWNANLSILEQFDLLDELNGMLNQIRKDLDIQPPMMWCPNCQKRHRSRFTNISITGMYHCLKRFDICEEDYFKILIRDWKKYSKTENIDIYGKSKETVENKNNEHD
jgi:hypothetical protein